MWEGNHEAKMNVQKLPLLRICCLPARRQEWKELKEYFAQIWQIPNLGCFMIFGGGDRTESFQVSRQWRLHGLARWYRMTCMFYNVYMYLYMVYDGHLRSFKIIYIRWFKCVCVCLTTSPKITMPTCAKLSQAWSATSASIAWEGGLKHRNALFVLSDYQTRRNIT